VYDKRANLYRSCEDNAIAFAYGDNGEIQYYESDYFHLWLENKRVENVSRNDFVRRFIDQVADTGAKIQLFDESAADSDGAGALLADHKCVKVKLQAQRNTAIAASDEITQLEAVSIRDTMQAQRDVEPAKKLSYEKWCLRQSYNWNERPLDAEFVANYNNTEVRRIYKNLKTISEGRTLAESLFFMRRKEVDQYSWTMGQRSAETMDSHESRDLMLDKSRYIYQSHCIAVWILRVCGFSTIVDRTRVHERELEGRLRASIPMMKRAVERIVFELEIPRPSLDRLSRESDRAAFLRGMLRFVNGVQRRMYGIQLQKTTKKEGGGAYRLARSAKGQLFVFQSEPEPDDTAGGPRPHIASNLEVIEFDRTDLFLSDVFYEEGFAEREGMDEPETYDDLDAELEVMEAECAAQATPADTPPEDDLDSLLVAAMNAAYESTKWKKPARVIETKTAPKRTVPVKIMSAKAPAAKNINTAVPAKSAKAAVPAKTAVSAKPAVPAKPAAPAKTAVPAKPALAI
jgi:hypothetical protein